MKQVIVSITAESAAIRITHYERADEGVELGVKDAFEVDHSGLTQHVFELAEGETLVIS